MTVAASANGWCGEAGLSLVVSWTSSRGPEDSLACRLVVPSTELANMSSPIAEFSSPVARRNLLSAFMTSESGTAGTSAGSEEPTEDAQDDAKNPQ